VKAQNVILIIIFIMSYYITLPQTLLRPVSQHKSHSMQDTQCPVRISTLTHGCYILLPWAGCLESSRGV